MKALVLVALLAAAPAFASCESIVSVQSRELDFQSFDTTSDDSLTDSEMDAMYRSVARAIAVAARCFDYALMHSCEAGTPPRTGIVLGSSLAVADPADSNAPSIVRACAVTPGDTVATLWTCEIGRFRTRDGAESFGIEPANPKEAFTPLRGHDAVLRWVTCGGNYEAGSFVVLLPGATLAPWSRRLGLFFTRADAERAGHAFEREWGRKPRIVRQRVNRQVLEQAFTSEC